MSWRIRNRTPHFQSLSVHAVLPPPDAVTDFLTTLMEREKIGSINGRENHNASGSNIVALPARRDVETTYPSVIRVQTEVGSLILLLKHYILRMPSHEICGGAITLRVSDSHADAALSAGADSKRRGFEVRWGNEAKSERMPVAPSTGMIKLILQREHSHRTPRKRFGNSPLLLPPQRRRHLRR